MKRVLWLNRVLTLQPFNNWLDGAREDLVDMFIVHTMEEIQGLLDAHEQFKATLGEADKEYQSIVGLVRQVESIAGEHQVPGGLDNPYTSLTAKVVRMDECQVTPLPTIAVSWCGHPPSTPRSALRSALGVLLLGCRCFFSQLETSCRRSALGSTLKNALSGLIPLGFPLRVVWAGVSSAIGA